MPKEIEKKIARGEFSLFYKNGYETGVSDFIKVLKSDKTIGDTVNHLMKDDGLYSPTEVKTIIQAAINNTSIKR